MSIQQSQGEVAERLSDKDVEIFLRQNPEFFADHTQLLSELKIPHITNGAVSLVERQVDVLRTKNNKIKKQLEDLIHIARSNEKLSKQVYKLTLKLMAADTLEEIFDLIQVNFRRDFLVDSVSLSLYAKPKVKKLTNHKEFVDKTSKLHTLFKKVLKEKRPVCGRFSEEQRDYLFGETAKEIRSLALLPLLSGESFGLLAIGSYDNQRFHSGLGTAYLVQISALLSKTMIRFVKPT